MDPESSITVGRTKMANKRKAEETGNKNFLTNLPNLCKLLYSKFTSPKLFNFPYNYIMFNYRYSVSLCPSQPRQCFEYGAIVGDVCETMEI
jgi:hypothetical protein